MASQTVTHICETCGNGFEVKASRLKHQPLRFCSSECWQSLRKRSKDDLLRVCINCDATFTAAHRQQLAKAKGGHFCSVPCRWDFIKKQTKATTAKRFWSHVDVTPGHGPKGECWVWTRGHTNGYGAFTLGGRSNTIPAHRQSWILHNGPIPDGMWVLHKCDNPPCVRPDHLFLGTSQDNVDDMMEKGRHASVTRPDYAPRGERVNTAKLTEEDVREIRRLRADGVGRKPIAARYGITPTSVTRITNGECWNHVK